MMVSIIELIEARHTKPLLLVAIDGHSAAGKSTLARQIADTLPAVTLVHTDDFYRVLDEEARAQLDAQGGYEQYYDWQRLETQVLMPLAGGQMARYQKYDWHNNCLGDWVETSPQGIVLIEGCYAARPQLRTYYDLLILVSTRADLRAQRQFQRADAPDWWPRWEAAEQYYMQTARPHEYADIIFKENIDGIME